MEERVQVWLSRAGYGSRRACEQLIREGRVDLKGERAVLGARTADPTEITVDGQVLRISRAERHYLLNKPRSYVSTMRDPEGRNTIAELLPKVEGRLFPVGRLDYGSEGLMLITSDGQLAQMLMHPKNGVEKEYEVKLKDALDEKQLERLRRGVVESGERLRLQSIRPLQSRSAHAWYSIVLTEGKNRHIRRMALALGVWIIKLKRVRIGALLLEDLKSGAYRELTPAELAGLRAGAKPLPLRQAKARPPRPPAKPAAPRREKSAPPEKKAAGSSKKLWNRQDPAKDKPRPPRKPDSGRRGPRP